MVVTAKTLAAGSVLALAIAAMVPNAASAQGFKLDKPRYTLTMPAGGWDTIAVPEGQGGGADMTVLAKLTGLGGLAYVSCEVGTAAPDMKAAAANFATVLGGNITIGRDSSLTLGKYQVKWQEFKFDSLPILSAMIRARAPFIPALSNDSLRLYYLVSDGYVFTVAGLRAVPRTTPPYADIETAIRTLVLKPQSGNVRFVAGRLGGGLWTREGILGGEWLKDHPALSVECYALDGAFAGAASATSEGEWMLPAHREALVVQVKSRDGHSLRLLAKP